jgi:adenosylcobinamide kinase/adenosylcobinamide-phosphate guanylyltransferase
LRPCRRRLRGTEGRLSHLVFVGGGVRSGKSAFALARAKKLGERRAFLATAQALDDEMRERVARHARERASDFRTVEAPYELAEALRGLADVDVAVVDCLTLWLSNLLLRGDDEAQIARAVDDLVDAATGAAFAVVVVSNEVGMGVVPEHPLGRAFRDVSGRAHQRLAASANEVHFAVLGCLLRLRPPPLALDEGWR